MSELIVLWSVSIALIASVVLQISDYKRRKLVNAEIQSLIKLIKGEEK